MGVMRGTRVVAAHGRKQVERVTLASDQLGEMQLACDLLVVSGGSAPATSLLSQAGARTAYDAGARRVRARPTCPTTCSPPARWPGPACSRTPSCPAAVAGAEAAHALGIGDAASRDRAEQGLERLAELARRPVEVAVPPPAPAKGDGKCFACLCEDVTVKDIHLSVAEGYDSIELSKRYTTTTMGPCQGRMCQLPAVRQMAEETGQTLAQVGTTTSRPPWHAVPMGALAGRPFEPAKRSAIHGRHREQGATVMWAGDWRRAYDYGDARAEALAVHEAAGPDRRVDARQADRARPGRGRAARPALPEPLLEPEAGPDPLRRDRERRRAASSTTARSAASTTTASTSPPPRRAPGAVYEWFSWWLADWRLDVQLTDVTQGLGAVNLAGPRAREIMGKLTELDCSSEAFTYLDGKQAEVAGVPS